MARPAGPGAFGVGEFGGVPPSGFGLRSRNGVRMCSEGRHTWLWDQALLGLPGSSISSQPAPGEGLRDGVGWGLWNGVG